MTSQLRKTNASLKEMKGESRVDYYSKTLSSYLDLFLEGK